MLLIYSFLASTVIAQSLTTTSQPKKLFNTEIQIRVHTRPSSRFVSPITFVSLHHNEELGLRLTKEALPLGGRLIEIVSIRNGTPKRLLSFEYREKTFCVDPNRIFSNAGIEKSLSEIDSDDDRDCQNNADAESREIARSQAVRDEVARFREDMLDIIMPEKRCAPSSRTKSRLCPNEVLVAVHNNTDYKENPGGINAQSFFRLANGVENRDIKYMPKGLEYDYSEAGYLVNSEDLDDFLMVSNRSILKKLLTANGANMNFSVGIQKANPPETHGYLSAYCGRNEINYIVVEAESNFGKSQVERAEERQKAMLKRIIEVYPSVRK